MKKKTPTVSDEFLEAFSFIAEDVAYRALRPQFGQFICDYGHVVPTFSGQVFSVCPVCVKQRRAWVQGRIYAASFQSALCG